LQPSGTNFTAHSNRDSIKSFGSVPLSHLRSIVDPDAKDIQEEATTLLNTSDASEAVSEVESDGNQWPMPDEDSDDCRVEGGTVKIFTLPDPVPRAKPDWWTEAWNQLEGEPAPRPYGWIQPLSPVQFRDECHIDVVAFDRPGAQTSLDLVAGETITANEDNE
jgi:hypothetical protein